MTLEEFRRHLFQGGLAQPMPQSVTVDAETYAHVCDAVFQSLYSRDPWMKSCLADDAGVGHLYPLALGAGGGILYKGVEIKLAPSVAA